MPTKSFSQLDNKQGNLGGMDVHLQRCALQSIGCDNVNPASCADIDNVIVDWLLTVILLWKLAMTFFYQ